MSNRPGPKPGGPNPGGFKKGLDHRRGTGGIMVEEFGRTALQLAAEKTPEAMQVLIDVFSDESNAPRDRTKDQRCQRLA